MNQTPDEVFARLARLVDLSALSRLRVSLLGLGRAGIAILQHLIRLPIQQIIGVDHDTVAARELGSVFPDLPGERFKVRAAKRIVEFWNPHIAFQPVLMQLSEETLARFLDLVSQSDILIWAADDWAMLERVCSVAHDEIPMVGCAMAEQARYAEVGWSAPGQTPPLSVTLQAGQKQSEGGAASLPVFVDAAANVVVSVALGIVLAGRKGGGQFRELVDPHHPLLVVHTARNGFTQSTNRVVPRLVRLMEVENR